MANLPILNALVNFFPWGFVKLLTVILCGLYVLYAIIILRQESLMSKVVEIPYMPVFKIIATVHFLASITALLLALIII